MSLKDRTPASVAGIRFPFRNWKDVCEQPYEVTARIPIKAYAPMPDDTLLPEIAKRTKKPIKRKARSREKPVTSVAEMRLR